MSKWTARIIIGILALWAFWAFVEGGWWIAAGVAVMAVATVLEVRWADRWPFRSSS